MAEKVMPHNIDAEQAVLGSMFLSKNAAQKCVENLTEGTPIDITTVTASLDDRKWLKSIGGVSYITELIDGVASAANVDEYIKIVNDKAILRRLIEEATNIVTDGYNSTDSLTEVLDKAESKILNVVKTRKGTEFRTIQDVLFKTQADLEKLAQTKGEITGIASGFYDLDKVTSGFHPNELIIIAARPAMGKTAFALNLATNIAMKDNKTVALFNMEMGAEQLAMRMLSSVGQIDGYKLKSGHLEHNDWKRINEAISRLADTKIFIDDTPGMTISEIKAKCRRLASSNDGLGIVIIDYLTLIQGSSRYSGNRQQEVSEISRALKTMAMELQIPVIALAQLSRNVEGREDKRPLLSDLRESGSIEQDADLVAFLYRDDYYTKQVSENPFVSESEFIIAKHRNGPTTTINLLFQRNTSTFVNVVKNEENR